MRRVLAIDMGATSIRGILACEEGQELFTEEVMRVNHHFAERDGRLRWDWKLLRESVLETVARYAQQIDSVAVDTWGVDFVLLDEHRRLLAEPVSYRDPSHEEGYREALASLSDQEIFIATGNQVMPINSLFQLLALRRLEPSIYERAAYFLTLPDYLNYLLCGKLEGEQSICSTTQMLDLRSGTWNNDLLARLGLKRTLFQPVRPSGSILARATEQYAGGRPAIVRAASHDTASAVSLTDAMNERDCLFLSTGTWCLLGSVTERAVITREAFAEGLSNESGLGGKNLLLKNLSGLYLVEKLREALATDGRLHSYEEIASFVAEAPAGEFLFDTEDPLFARADLEMAAALDEERLRQGKAVLTNKCAYYRAVYESLSATIARTAAALARVSGEKYKKLHLLGGGSRATWFCQMIADALNMELWLGPSEATALGNILTQFAVLRAEDGEKGKEKSMLRAFESACYRPRV